MKKEIKKQLSKLPNTPGVYIFRNKADKILYIGKAASIKKRVQSYFRDRPILLPRIEKMVPQIAKIDFIKTNSEIDALLLESDFIKKQKPKYNVEWKDDKNYLYIKVNGLTSGRVDEKERERDFPGIFIERKPDKTEPKAKYFGPFTDAGAVRKTVSFLRRIFPSRACKKFPKRACLLYHINRCPGPCVNAISKREYQKTIGQAIAFLQGKRTSLVKGLKREMKEAAKKQEFERAAKIRDKIFALEHIERVSILKREARGEGALWGLTNFLKKFYPGLLFHSSFKIEAYDVSNIFGTSGTGSMVVFIDGEKETNEYRRFAIKTVRPGRMDDVACMKEVLKRRFAHKDEWLLPDLIILDGGKGQLAAVRQALKEARLSIPYLALAKKEEQIYLPRRLKAISLPPDSPALLLLRRIRDEAHRFAKSYHIKLRGKRMLRS